MTHPETKLHKHGRRFSWRNLMSDTSIDRDILRDAPGLVFYALLVPPGREFIAQKMLRREGLRTFVPVRREYRRKNKFVKEKSLKEYAVAPRYVFAGFKPGVPLWFDLFSMHIINGVVGLGGKPTRIQNERMVKFIIKTGGGLNAPEVEKFMRTHHEFKIGQTVEVIGGPFEGRKVPVVSIHNARAEVMTELFGVEMKVEVPVEFLQAA